MSYGSQTSAWRRLLTWIIVRSTARHECALHRYSRTIVSAALHLPADGHEHTAGHAGTQQGSGMWSSLVLSWTNIWLQDHPRCQLIQSVAHGASTIDLAIGRSSSEKADEKLLNPGPSFSR